MVIRSFLTGFTLDPCGLTDTICMVFVTEKTWRSLYPEARFRNLKSVQAVEISEDFIPGVELRLLQKEILTWDSVYFRGAEQLNLP